MFEWLDEQWPTIVALIDLVLALFVSAHALLHKRDPRSAIAWVGLIWLVPLLGAVLYALLGINRIHRRALDLKASRGVTVVAPTNVRASRAEIATAMGLGREHLLQIARAGDALLTRRPIVAGNAVEPLELGDAAYPAMLAAIDRAERSIALQTYIFDNDPVGREFVAALARAVARGVQVRVLVDAVGLRYTWPSIYGQLVRAGVPTARFLRTIAPPRLPFANLRCHRKVLMIDGRVAFTGGMNIREGHVLARRPVHPVTDLHFRVEGPVVAHLGEIFAEDWAFTTREKLAGDAWFPELAPVGPTLVRAVPDGPDDNRRVLRLLLQSALAAARERVRIVTPYFVPDAAVIAALATTALRGVRVDLILPAVGNVRLAQWASNALLWETLQHGCRVHLSPPPFDHTKLMVVDDAWAMVGSMNWDARSLRLNFELNLECYDTTLARRLAALADGRQARSREISLAEMDARPLALRLRDGVAKLGAPYL